MPPEMEAYIVALMERSVHDAVIFTERLAQATSVMAEAGMSADVITATLQNDLLTNGKIFGELNNSIKRGINEGVNQSGRLGQAEQYPPGKQNYVWVTVAGHRVCPDCDGRSGQMMTWDEWTSEGLPGTGWSFCGGNCYCVLDPEGKMGDTVEAPARVREPGATIKKPKPIASRKTTYTDFDKGYKEIENYFIQQEKINPTGVQLMEGYSATKYYGLNEVGRKWANEIALKNSMLLKTVSIFEKTLKGAGNVFRVLGSKAWKERFIELKSFLSKTPDYVGKSFRGIKFDHNVDLAKFLTRFKTGSIIETKTFWSTTFDRNIATNFSGTTFARANITIHGRSGTILDKHSHHMLEKEVLFNAGTKFKVKSVRKGKSVSGKGESVNIILEEIL